MIDIQAKVREYISDNRTEDAIQELLAWSETHSNSSLRNDIILLKSRFTRVKQQERIGVISYTDALREQSILANSLLDITQRLELPTNGVTFPENKVERGKKVILFLASAPLDQAKLQLEKEFARIFSSLQLGIVEYKLVAEWAITADSMQQAILKHKPNFIHFSGHGETGNELEGGIILINSESKAQLVSGKALENMFRIFSRKVDIEIVLLNSCYSEDQAHGINKHVPYVIGMNDQVGDDSAIEFSTGFYRGLADEEDVEFAFDLAVNMIQLQGLDDDAVPVLLRGSTKASAPQSE
ncbi:hypothetical protein GGR28_003188 [Lewinella aquimaris]|uniref:CHAT domain-containing protein n=1 Tax=Neolewinella aquimaris TaxID=1835722 RepID=A0A840E4J9_9BACT|nr:CHAT domain-containing protein [Neolewinella aquimaris]MBB4080554.1 hypothetical protein [Neolewinella aquimaris]